MVLEVWKRFKSTHFFIPNSFRLFNFAQKSIPWVVLALVLLLDVLGTGPGPELYPDGHKGHEKTLNQPSFSFPTAFAKTTLPRN